MKVSKIREVQETLLNFHFLYIIQISIGNAEPKDTHKKHSNAAFTAFIGSSIKPKVKSCMD